MLTTLANVKTRLKLTDTVDDALLTNIIGGISARFARFCDRVFDRTAGAMFEFQADYCEVVPLIYPIETVASFDLKTSESEGWVAQTGIDFLIRNKCIVSLETQLGSWKQIARMTYTAGFVLPGSSPGAGQTALPADIEMACFEQVAYWYQRKDQLGLVGVTGPDGSIQQFAKLDLLPSVEAALDAHKRFNL